MSILFVVLPLSLLIAIGALVSFVWATKSGQFDDLESPQHRILHEAKEELAWLQDESLDIRYQEEEKKEEKEMLPQDDSPAYSATSSSR